MGKFSKFSPCNRIGLFFLFKVVQYFKLSFFFFILLCHPFSCPLQMFEMLLGSYTKADPQANFSPELAVSPRGGRPLRPPASVCSGLAVCQSGESMRLWHLHVASVTYTTCPPLPCPELFWCLALLLICPDFRCRLTPSCGTLWTTTLAYGLGSSLVTRGRHPKLCGCLKGTVAALWPP